MTAAITPQKDATALSTSEVERRLFKKYHGNDFSICMEVRNAAGFNASRSCDALGIGLWPSRGCHVHGFEIKVSRADWLRELKDGAKADAFHRYCDFWHLAVGDKSIVREDELPEGWGLLVPHGDSLRELVPPAKITAEPMPRGMLAAFIKRAATQAPLKSVLDERYEAGKQQGIAQEKVRREHQAGDGPKFEALRAKVDAFARATGISLEYVSEARADQLKALWAALQRNDHGWITLNLRQHAERLAAAAAQLHEAAASLTAAGSDNISERVSA